MARSRQGTRHRIRAAALSVAAGAVHGLATAEHLREWWGYGLFFLLAGGAQVLYGVLLLVRPWRYDDSGGVRPDEGRRHERAFVLAGIAGNAAVVLLYVVTRTLGIPFFGPEAGEVEPVTPVGVVSKALELALIASLVALLRLTPAAPAVDNSPAGD